MINEIKGNSNISQVTGQNTTGQQTTTTSGVQRSSKNSFVHLNRIKIDTDEIFVINVSKNFIKFF